MTSAEDPTASSTALVMKVNKIVDLMQCKLELRRRHYLKYSLQVSCKDHVMSIEDTMFVARLLRV